MDAIIIAFASGKGGTGKSTVAVMVGGALAALDKKVVLVELSAGLRSVDVIAAVSDQAVFDLEDVLNGKTPPAKAVLESPAYPGLSVIPAPFEADGLPAGNLRLLVGRLRAHYDYVLLDAPNGMGEQVQAAIEVAHRLVLVETPDAVALRDGRKIIDMIDKANREEIAIRLLLNRVCVKSVLEDGIIEDLDAAIDTVGAQLLGVVPESTAIHKAACLGNAVPPHTREGNVFAAVAKRVMGEDVPLIMQ